MGHRCLVAYENEEGRFDARYSHWGGHALELRNGITEQTPLGGSAADYEPDYIDGLLSGLESVADKADMAVEGYLTDAQDDRAVEAEPLARDLSMADVASLVDASDFHVEALYVVTSGFDVRAFQPLYVGFLEAGSLLLEPRWVGDEPVSNSYDRGWFKGAQSELSRFVEDGLITEAEAAKRLVGRVLERAAEHSSKQVLAHSSAVTDGDHEQWPLAFVPVMGRSRLHNRSDEMLPTAYGQIDHWELPEGFEAVLPEPVREDERPSLTAGPKPEPTPFTNTASLDGVSGSFEIGDRVFDRTKNRSGPGSHNTLVVVWKPEESAADYVIESMGRTVAEVNPGFSPDESVAEAVYVNDLPAHIDPTDNEQIAECYQRGDLENAVESVYAFPQSRLGAVNDDGETVGQATV